MQNDVHAQNASRVLDDVFARPLMLPTDLRELVINTPLARADWPIENLLAPGLTLLSGDPRSGKTSLAFQLMQHVTHGTRAFGSEEDFASVERGVLYFGLDLSLLRMRELYARYAEAHGETQPGARCHLTNSWPALTPEGGLQQLETWLASHPDTRLLVIDNLVALRRLFKGNDRELMALLRRLAEQQEISILLLHTCKPSSPLIGYADHHLHLKRLNVPSYYRLDVLGTALEPTSHHLYCAPGTLRFELAAPEDKLALSTLNARKAFSRERLAILSLFQERDCLLTPAQVAEDLQINLVNARQVLHTMAAANMLSVPRYGHYALDPHIAPLLPELLLRNPILAELTEQPEAIEQPPEVAEPHDTNNTNDTNDSAVVPPIPDGPASGRLTESTPASNTIPSTNGTIPPTILAPGLYSQFNRAQRRALFRLR